MKTITFALFLLTSFPGWAQISQPVPNRPAPTTVTAPSSMAAIGPEMNAALSQLEQAAQQTSMHLGGLSVKKWKTDSAVKDQVQHDISSIQSNVSATLPPLLSQVRSAPDNTAVIFRLYRNVDALVDVVRGLAESAGAFGPKNEFETLQSDSQSLASVRSTLASQLEAVATAKESAFAAMKSQLAQAQANAAAAPPRKIIVDEDTPKKKPRKKSGTSAGQSGTQSPKQ